MKSIRYGGAALIALALLIGPFSTAQPSPVTGRVLDADTEEALLGVTVFVEGSTLGTSTDTDGRFRLRLPEEEATLTFSFIGYQTERVVARRGVELDVVLHPTTSDLQPVAVTGSRTARARAEAPVAIATVSAADLEATKPNLLADALNRAPGVYMADLSNEQHAMSIRQPISYKPFFVYLEDGVPIRPAGLFNHNALIEVNMAATDQIEIVRGPSSALYGAGAIGGAVNVTTPTPSRNGFGEMALRINESGYGRADLEASGTSGGVGLYAGGYLSGQRDGVREHSDYEKASFTLRADHTLAAGTRLTATASLNALTTDTDGSLDSTNFFGEGVTSLQTFTNREVRAGRAALRVDHVWDARQRTMATLFGRANRVGQTPHYRLRLDAEDPSRASGEVNDNTFRSIGALAHHEVVWSRARVLVGGLVDVTPSNYVASYIDVRRDPATGVFTGYTATDSLLTDYDITLTNLAAFAQGEFEPAPHLKLVAGVRADRVGYALDNHLPPGSFSGAADRKDAFFRLTPRVGALYAFAPQTGLYMNASQGFLPPEAGELYRGVQVPTLRPATFDSYEVGGFVQAWGSRLFADAAVYRMTGKDEIVSVRRPDGSREDRNAGATRHEGIELALTVQPTSSVTARFSGTVARHTYVDFLVDERGGQEVRYDGNQMERAPEHIMNAEVAVRPPQIQGLRLAAEVQRVGAYWMDALNTTRYDGHTVLNLRARYAGDRLGGLEVWASLLNATDALYATTAAISFGRKQYTPGLPRSITLGVGYRFGQ